WMAGHVVALTRGISSELEETIRAMFRLYRNARVCIAYLHLSSTPSDFSMDRGGPSRSFSLHTHGEVLSEKSGTYQQFEK
ncbi:hypothetical protein BDR05DRAFT_890174, partial [Suillus weaverae]